MAAARHRWPRGYLLALAGSVIVALLCIGRILERAGEPAFPLDDAFIHLQYARRLSEGHWFSFSPGAPYSSGATSFLWPVALVPFFWLGLDDLELVWAAWSLGTLLHAAVAYETWRLGRGLTGETPALAAGAMCLVFGAFAWFAFSGMETIALAWVLVRGARVAAEDHEAMQRDPRRKPGWQLALHGLLAPLVRPEGALVSLMSALTSATGWRRGRGSSVAIALVACAGPFVVPLSHRLGAGHATSSTAMVKHLAADPYLDGAGVLSAALANAELLVSDLLQGGAWTAVFVPEGMGLAICLGLLLLWPAARRQRAWWRALMVLLVVLGTLGPTSYATMLWNRVRYIWPFAPGWFLAIACAAGEIGRWMIPGKERPRGAIHNFGGIVGPALSWGAVALLAAKLDWASADLATSARAIARQQVSLGKWAREHLPDNAIVGVNDTGAIAYLSRKSTFDVVGLTTEGEARYWAAGPGSRFEHYERLRAEGVAALPTHFIVYPRWMAMPALHGRPLTQRTVLDQSILGGHTMSAFEADYRLAGTGERPFSRQPGELLDRIDVSDLESESEHRFAVGEARAHLNVAAVGTSPEGYQLADGGRLERIEDRFSLAVRRPSRLVMRVSAAARLEVWADGSRVGEPTPAAEGRPWRELEIVLPYGARVVTVRSTTGERFASFHYWLYASD